jgi:hypothetical protein
MHRVTNGGAKKKKRLVATLRLEPSLLHAGMAFLATPFYMATLPPLTSPYRTREDQTVSRGISCQEL